MSKTKFKSTHLASTVRTEREIYTEDAQVMIKYVQKTKGLLRTYIHIYVHTFIYTYIHSYIRTYIHTYAYTLL